MHHRIKFSKTAIVSFGLAACLLLEPVTASAASILPCAGVASILETSLTEADYIQIAEEAKGALWGYTNIGICNVDEGNLNVRAESSTSGKLTGKLPKDAACEIIAEVDGWVQIKSGEVEGYVKKTDDSTGKDYLLTGVEARLKAAELVHTVAVSETDGLYVREEPNTDCAIVTQVLKGEELEYVETIDRWIGVSIDGEEAYVSAQYVTVKETLDTAITMTELLYGAGVSDIRVEVVEYAKQFVGNPYVWGGTSLTKGTDCSGFVQSVYKHFGIKLSRTSRSQVNDGTRISMSELQPGDLVFYTNGSGTINHVALYIGGSKVVHASSPKSGIKISKYNYRTPYKAVSVLYD
ncbi:MAG: peptidoglycan endopeptidase [Lachnospiraceae bacterium]|nr:peptidoglycan endopeptidase [Lachnospiraceae bacterium]